MPHFSTFWCSFSVLRILDIFRSIFAPNLPFFTPFGALWEEASPPVAAQAATPPLLGSKQRILVNVVSPWVVVTVVVVLITVLHPITKTIRHLRNFCPFSPLLPQISLNFPFMPVFTPNFHHFSPFQIPPNPHFHFCP